MRSREIIVPRNVPVENFTSTWSVTSVKSSSCLLLKCCIYVVILLLVLIILGVVMFLIMTDKLGSMSSSNVTVLNNRKGETSSSGIAWAG